MKICYLWATTPIRVVGNTANAVHTQSMCQAFKRLGHHIFIVSGELEKTIELGDTQCLFPIHVIPSPKPVPVTSWIYESIMKPSSTQEVPDNIVDSSIPAGRYVPGLRVSLIWRDIEQFISSFRYQWNFYCYALPVLEQEHIDMIYQRYTRYGLAGIWLAKDLGIPLILEMNASLTQPREWFRQPSPFYPLMIKKTERYLFRHATAVIVVSDVLKSYLNKISVNKNRIAVLPNAADLKLFQPDEQASMSIRKMYGLVDKFVVGFVGAMRPWHDIATILEGVHLVAQNYPDICALVVGDGPSRHALERRSEELGLDNRITFVGSVPHNEVPGYIGSMDITVFLTPVAGNYGGSPMKLFEYMAMAKPVIASLNGQMSDIIQHSQNGILVEPEDPKQVAEAILELAKKPDLREQSRTGRPSDSGEQAYLGKKCTKSH